MGLFLSLSGVANVPTAAVRDALTEYALSRKGKLVPAKPGAQNHEVLILEPSPAGHVTAWYPGGFFEWDDASAFLSKRLARPTFSFHIHDGDLWMYTLFVGDKDVDRFNPIPRYWDDELPQAEVRRWAGSATVLARHWPSADAGTLARYLKTWDLDDEDPPKAHADDEFTAGTDWQLLDFMRRLDLKYPIDDAGNAHGEKFAFNIPQDR